MAKPHKCPVCDGTTKREDGSQCVSCEKGIVWERDGRDTGSPAVITLPIVIQPRPVAPSEPVVFPLPWVDPVAWPRHPEPYHHGVVITC